MHGITVTVELPVISLHAGTNLRKSFETEFWAMNEATNSCGG